MPASAKVLDTIYQRVKREIAGWRAGRVVITDNRVAHNREETLVESTMVELLHRIDTSGDDARDRWLAQASYTFDLFHGRVPAPRPKGAA